MQNFDLFLLNPNSNAPKRVPSDEPPLINLEIIVNQQKANTEQYPGQDTEKDTDRTLVGRLAIADCLTESEVWRRMQVSWEKRI